MRIAYVANDATLRVHDSLADDPDDRLVSVPGLRCTWPVWSPDGRFVAFSGYAGGSNGSALIAIYVTAADDGGPDSSPGLIYSNEPGTDAIAGGTPHYCSWSPDGSRLAFVASTLRGLALHVWEASAGSPPRAIHEGGPLYFTWSPRSTEMFIHSFASHYLAGTSGEGPPSQFPGVSTQYMSPSWAGDGDRIAFFLDGDRGRQRLVAIDLDGQAVRVLTEFSGIAAAAWRPGSSQVGLVKAMIGSSGFYSGLWAIDYETQEETQITDDPVLAFYWSPDGSCVAYVTSSEGAEGSLRLGVVSISDGGRVYLPDFRPSQEQLTQFMYFDQYAQSHTIWSPDGRHLLIFGEIGYHVSRTPLSTGDANRVLALDASGASDPLDVAGGFVGCWGYYPSGV